MGMGMGMGATFARHLRAPSHGVTRAPSITYPLYGYFGHHVYRYFALKDILGMSLSYGQGSRHPLNRYTDISGISYTDISGYTDMLGMPLSYGHQQKAKSTKQQSTKQKSKKQNEPIINQKATRRKQKSKSKNNK